MIALLLAFTMAFADSSFTGSTQTYYAQQNADALERLMQEADSRFEELLCRYRLYPLTENEALLEDLPERLEDGTARELALLSGLWGYRAARASLFSAIQHGRRAEQLLEAAKAKDPNDPFVLLVEGQSLIFKPAIAGRDEEAALHRFSQLRDVLQRVDANIGISRMEAELWRWYALHRLGIDRAPQVREQLLAVNPPPLYRQFLQDPP
jgi:hypothetical protein